ncbi:hypothetical protein SAMN05519104_7647 [Rhizobiales bacterium GAS188]|nr:hypothetical protein SAMN05519104_7647 [Rhizobiales bacterium GAS188]
MNTMTKQAVLTVKKLVALDPEMVRRIESFRFSERINTESEAIRRLIELGLSRSASKAKFGTRPG